MIKNNIFDMGNVLIYFDPAFFIDKVGVTVEEDRRILLREIYGSIVWAQMDRGTRSEAEATERMKGHIPERLHGKVDLLVRDWNRPIMPVPGMSELARELKDAGYGIYLHSIIITTSFEKDPAYGSLSLILL